MTTRNTNKWRKEQNVTQLNIHMDIETKDQFARMCRTKEIAQREVIERLVIGWISGTIQLP